MPVLHESIALTGIHLPVSSNTIAHFLHIHIIDLDYAHPYKQETNHMHCMHAIENSSSILTLHSLKR